MCSGGPRSPDPYTLNKVRIETDVYCILGTCSTDKMKTRFFKDLLRETSINTGRNDIPKRHYLDVQGGMTAPARSYQYRPPETPFLVDITATFVTVRVPLDTMPL